MHTLYSNKIFESYFVVGNAMFRRMFCICFLVWMKQAYVEKRHIWWSHVSTFHTFHIHIVFIAEKKGSESNGHRERYQSMIVVTRLPKKKRRNAKQRIETCMKRCKRTKCMTIKCVGLYYRLWSGNDLNKAAWITKLYSQVYCISPA